MKKLPVFILLLSCLTVYVKAQTLFGADAYGVKTKAIGFIEDGKIYNADSYGVKDKIIGFIEDGKEYDMLFSSDKYQLKKNPVGFIEDEKLLQIYQTKTKVCALFSNGKVYVVDRFGVKGRIIGFYSGNRKAGAACAAIILLLR